MVRALRALDRNYGAGCGCQSHYACRSCRLFVALPEAYRLKLTYVEYHIRGSRKVTHHFMEVMAWSSSLAMSELGHDFFNCLRAEDQRRLHERHTIHPATHSSFALSPRSLHSFAAARHSSHNT